MERNYGGARHNRIGALSASIKAAQLIAPLPSAPYQRVLEIACSLHFI